MRKVPPTWLTLLSGLLAGWASPSLTAARPAQAAHTLRSAVEPHDVVELCELPARLKTAGGAGHRRRALQRRSAALLRAAVVDYDAGRFAESLRTLQRAYALLPQADTLFNMAQACRAAGRAEQALALYAAVLRLGPDPSLRADTQRRSGELRDKLAQKHDEHARQLLESQDYSGAQLAWETAYEVSPQPIFQFRIARAQQRSGQLREALAAYGRFLHEDPQNELRPEAERDMRRLHGRLEGATAQQHSELGHFSAAIASWDAAYRYDPEPAYLRGRADSERQAGLLRDALASYQRVLDADPPTSLRTEVSASVEQLTLELTPPAPALRPAPLALASLPLLASTAPRKSAPLKAAKEPVYRRWWFWTAMGAGALAAAIPVLVTQLPIQPSYPDLRMVTFPGAPAR